MIWARLAACAICAAMGLTLASCGSAPSTSVANPVDFTMTERTGASGLRYRVAVPDTPPPPDGFDVIVHLHGATLSWNGLAGDVEALADMASVAHAAGTLPATVVIAPHDAAGWSMWTDSHDGSNDVASAIVEDVRGRLASDLALTTEASGRHLSGFSMGGFGVASLVFVHDDVFSSAIVWDGAMHDWASLTSRRPHIARDQFGDDAAFFAAWSPYDVADASADRRLLVVRGAMSAFFERYVAHLERVGVAVTPMETGCGHDVRCLVAEAGAAAAEFLGTAP